MKGLEIINKRLIYLSQVGDSPEYIQLIEKEVKAFNDARAGMESQELAELKRINAMVKEMLGKEEKSMKVYMVGDTYTHIETGESFELTAIGTDDMTGKKCLTNVVTGQWMWLPDDELNANFKLTSH